MRTELFGARGLPIRGAYCIVRGDHTAFYFIMKLLRKTTMKSPSLLFLLPDDRSSPASSTTVRVPTDCRLLQQHPDSLQ